MNKEQALHSFFSSFNIPAYEENSVPIDAEFPRITYQLVTDSFNSIVAITASIWYRDESWTKITNKLYEVIDYVDYSKFIPFDDGSIFITQGSPFTQNMTDEADKLIKRKVLNFNLEYITLR